MNKLVLLALAATLTLGEETPFSSVTDPTCPGRKTPGSCTDVGKCCDWTWPPPLTNKVSCDSTIPGSCINCKPPGCCCQAGLMCLTPEGGIAVASCCSYFLKSGLICNKFKDDGTPDCGEEVFLCKTISNADCDKCGARCIEFVD